MARIILRVGKNLDGYWDSNRLCVQLKAIFAAFETSREPGRQMLAVFDNSTGRNAYSPDALRAQNIRASPGGEQIPPLNFEYNGRTIYTTFREGDVLRFRSSPFARKTDAEAAAKKRNGKKLGVFPVGTVVKQGTSSEKLIGVAKGMKEILEDMGLYKLVGETKTPPLLCQRCKDEAKAKRDKSTMYNKGGESRQQALEGEGDSDDSDEDSGEGGACDAVRTSRRCCCQRIISEVKAFKEQMNRVEELFEAAGHVCIFLAKYHPELNAIERFWGYTKSIERRVCDYSVLSLLARLPVTLSTVSLSLCRKWARVSWLYIYAYSHGLEGYLQTRDPKKNFGVIFAQKRPFSPIFFGPGYRCFSTLRFFSSFFRVSTLKSKREKVGVTLWENLTGRTLVTSLYGFVGEDHMYPRDPTVGEPYRVVRSVRSL